MSIYIIFLTLLVIPVIVSPSDGFQYIVNEGMPATFVCIATGIPPPEIKFYLGNLELNSTFDPRIALADPVTETVNISGESVYQVTQELTFSTTLDMDSDNYTCVAANENVRQPTDTVVFELIVRGKYLQVMHIRLANMLLLFHSCSQYNIRSREPNCSAR